MRRRAARRAHRFPAGKAHRHASLVRAGRRQGRGRARRRVAAAGRRPTPARRSNCTVKGHAVHVPKAAMGVARFSFPDLCEQPLGASDYLKIAHEFHTLIIDHIPVMDYDAAQRGQALHHSDRHALRQCGEDDRVGGDAKPDELYRADEGFEAKEFKRTASRLIEMRSQSYLGAAARPAPRRDHARQASSKAEFAACERLGRRRRMPLDYGQGRCWYYVYTIEASAEASCCP